MMPDRVSILTVSSFDEDHRATEAILRRSKWDHHTARTIAEALRLMRSADVSVILCERDLPDGSWKDLLTAVADPELGAHSSSVAKLAGRVARRLGLPEAECEDVRLAAALHDVGKMAIPDAILEKPTKLTDDEWVFLRRHTLIGERILLAAPALAQIAPLVRASHERFDGDGYPDRLTGGAIPLAARIVFVCDSFDAMTSPRAYATEKTIEAALDELVRNAGAQFDPDVVQAFREVVAAQGAPRIALAS